MKKSKYRGDFRIGSLTDAEVFEIDLTKMSTAFMAAFLSRPINTSLLTQGKFYSLKDEEMREMALKSVELAHYLMIEIQECVEKYGEN